MQASAIENQFPVLIVVLVQSGKLMEWINVVHPMMILGPQNKTIIISD
jgi:hypothetical protein